MKKNFLLIFLVVLFAASLRAQPVHCQYQAVNFGSISSNGSGLTNPITIQPYPISNSITIFGVKYVAGPSQSFYPTNAGNTNAVADLYLYPNQYRLLISGLTQGILFVVTNTTDTIQLTSQTASGAGVYFAQPVWSYSVRVTTNDTSPDLLTSKIVAGPNTTIAVLNPGANEQLQISSGTNGGVGSATNFTGVLNFSNLPPTVAMLKSNQVFLGNNGFTNQVGLSNGFNVGGYSINISSNSVYLAGFGTSAALGIFNQISSSIWTNTTTAAYIQLIGGSFNCNTSAGVTMYTSAALINPSWTVSGSGSSPAGSSTYCAYDIGAHFLGGIVVGTNITFTGGTFVNPNIALPTVNGAFLMDGGAFGSWNYGIISGNVYWASVNFPGTLFVLSTNGTFGVANQSPFLQAASAVGTTNTGPSSFTNTANVLAGNGTGVTNAQAGSLNPAAVTQSYTNAVAASQATITNPVTVGGVTYWLDGTGSHGSNTVNAASGGFDTNRYLVGNPVTQMGTNATAAANAVVSSNLPAWNGSNYIFISAMGLPNASGLNEQNAVTNIILATQLSTNGAYGRAASSNVLVLLPGVFNTYGSSVNLPDNTSWFSEPGSTLYWTNASSGSISSAGFTVGNNSKVWNLNMLNPDQNNSECCIGEGSSDATLGIDGKTNWAFYNLNLVTYGIGLHWEGGNKPAYKQGIFFNPVILANRSCLTMKMPNTDFTLINPFFTVLNFTNNVVANAKPLAVIDVETFAAFQTNHPAVTVIGGQFNYSDVDLSISNRPVYAVWGGNQFGVSGLSSPSNVVYMSGTVLNPFSITNPASYDFEGATNGSYLVSATVTRRDGRYPTVTNTLGDCMIHTLTTYPTNSPTVGVTNVLQSDGTKTWWMNDNGLF